MKSACALLVAALTFSASASDHRAIPRRSDRHHSTSQHEGSSPFPPPDAADTVFIVDAGDDLDTDCTYRSHGALEIHLPMPRYVGDVSANGELVEPETLFANGVLSRTAHLRLPAYDVDVNGDPFDSSKPPEVDAVYFNDHYLGSLTGDNDVWKLNEFEIQTEWIRFPAKGADGVAPTPADNVIRIYIDTASADDNWCTAVDWVELDFSAIAPVFFVHGIFSGPDTWSDFVEPFRARKVPFSNDIQLLRTGSRDQNAFLLESRLRSLAMSFGAKSCHVVAHSKGGLDTRTYLDSRYDPQSLKVLSVYTLSTPHYGSAIADVVFALATGIDPETAAVITESMPASADLTTPAASIYNVFHHTTPAEHFYTFGAEADLNGDHIIDAHEAEGVGPPGVATLCHTILRNERPVKVTVSKTSVPLWGDLSISLVDIDVSRNVTPNDVFVATTSAAAPFGAYVSTESANHKTIKSQSLADRIVTMIEADYPAR